MRITFSQIPRKSGLPSSSCSHQDITHSSNFSVLNRSTGIMKLCVCCQALDSPRVFGTPPGQSHHSSVTTLIESAGAGYELCAFFLTCSRKSLEELTAEDQEDFQGSDAQLYCTGYTYGKTWKKFHIHTLFTDGKEIFRIGGMHQLCPYNCSTNR